MISDVCLCCVSIAEFDSYLSGTPWSQVPKRAKAHYYLRVVSDHHPQTYLINLQLGIFVKQGLGFHKLVVE